MKIHAYGIEKTTIRLTVKLPDNYGRVQRLHDYGAWFNLEEEVIRDVDKLADLLIRLKDRGAKLIDENEFVDDDDMQLKHTFTYELVS